MNKDRRRSFSTIAGCIVLAGITVLAVVALDNEADENRQVAMQLAEIETKAQNINALEWQAIAEGEAASEAVRELVEVRSQLLAAVSSLQARYPKATVLSRFNQTYSEYSAAVDEEIRLLQAGDFEQARELDESRVDPSFDELMGALGQTRGAFEQIAQQGLHHVQIWLLVVAFGSTASKDQNS